MMLKGEKRGTTEKTESKKSVNWEESKKERKRERKIKI